MKNYITQRGYHRLKQELQQLLDVERMQTVRAVSLAASNGDRSENADYLYAKRRLREIDKRILFLTTRLKKAEIVVVHPGHMPKQIFFGATIEYEICSKDKEKSVHTITIVGEDEIDLDKGHISWASPTAAALLKAYAGDTVKVNTPQGTHTLHILKVHY